MKPTQAKSIVVLTGAGVSAESGLATFRDNNGLWENHRVEEVATPEAFESAPELVHRFYNQRRLQLVDHAKPNPAHRALAHFEKKFSGNFLLVTQNVDDLHERAGSVKLLHMHGELRKARCIYSTKTFPWDAPIDVNTRCPCCAAKGGLRPHIVWFGEMPFHMQEIQAALQNCDLFVAIGTSGQVYPAAGFVQLAKRAGAAVVEINLQPTSSSAVFDYGFYGRATEVVGKFFSGEVDQIVS